MSSQMSRRALLKAGMSSAATFMIVRSGALARGKSPNEKLNIAFIGCGKRGQGNIKNVDSENIVALCDPQERNLSILAKKYPKAKLYSDWRQCLEQKDIDAVVSQPPDHHHAFINIWAMNRGYHIYSEKPLANTVGEARLVRETYLKNKTKLATQMGVQRHEIPNMHRISELIHDGAIGTPLEVRLWCGRTPPGGDFPAPDPVPAGMKWDLWIGPTQFVPFSNEFIKGGCLAWNRFWPFGCGQITDMGSHIMDIAWWALDLGAPLSCKCEGSEYNKSTVPTWITAEWEHPANSWHPAMKVYWYDGGKMPGMPTPIFNREEMKGDHAIFKGTEGFLVCDFQNRILVPSPKNGDLTYYKPRTKETQIPQSPGHFKEWILACKTDLKTRTSFDYCGTMLEQNLLSLVSYRVGKKIQYDPATGKAPGCPEADQFLSKTYRPGWTLNG